MTMIPLTGKNRVRRGTSGTSGTLNELAPAIFPEKRSADYQIDLPLARLAPGEYLLTINATLGKHEAKRDVRFAVK
jgi:hypothetical protein